MQLLESESMRDYLVKMLAIAGMVALCGCGGGGDTPKLGNVIGKVTIDGKPSQHVIVTFTPVAGGRSSSGLTDDLGNFKLIYSSSGMGASVGRHVVTISANTEYTDEELNNPKIDLTKPKIDIPQDYLKMKKEVEVKAGSNTIDLEYP